MPPLLNERLPDEELIKKYTLEIENAEEGIVLLIDDVYSNGNTLRAMELAVLSKFGNRDIIKAVVLPFFSGKTNTTLNWSSKTSEALKDFPALLLKPFITPVFFAVTSSVTCLSVNCISLLFRKITSPQPVLSHFATFGYSKFLPVPHFGQVKSCCVDKVNCTPKSSLVICEA